MKSILPLLGVCVVVASAGAKEPEKKKASTVPGPYPSIIRMTPAGEPGPVSRGIIQSELGGREIQFLQGANQAANEQLALTELAKTRDGSEQVKAVAEALSTTQATESKEVARIAAARQVTLSAGGAKAINDALGDLSGAKFEKVWIERLMAVNEAAVAAYEVGVKSTDAEIRSFAEQMLPVASARLQMANRLGGRSVAAKTPATPAPVAAGPSKDNDATPQSIPPPISPAKP